MKDTAYTRRPWFTGRIALPVDREGHPLEPQVADQYIASDDLYSTPADYARFIISLVGQQGIDGALAADRVRIQVSRMAELCPPDRTKDCPADAGFGLGWEVFRFPDESFLMHTGMDEGVFTFGYFSPSTVAARWSSPAARTARCWCCRRTRSVDVASTDFRARAPDKRRSCLDSVGAHRTLTSPCDISSPTFSPLTLALRR